YWQAGRTGEAIDLVEQVVADRERLLGADHPDTLTARGNLAAIYWQAGRTGEAIDLVEQVVADRERLLGADHPDTLTAREVLSLWKSPENGSDRPRR
ncbi:tetratricopeptide repeat protein, partial [Streptomyces avermitilis]|uniref:tetratricopeptide repeat protein n=2 Tax=Streptomyces avermitilis TaxID=33903 RepID=UPI0034111D5C